MAMIAYFIPACNYLADFFVLGEKREEFEDRSGWYRLDGNVTMVTYTSILIVMVLAFTMLSYLKIIVTYKFKIVNDTAHSLREITNEFEHLNKKINEEIRRKTLPNSTDGKEEFAISKQNEEIQDDLFKDCIDVHPTVDILDLSKDGVSIKSGEGDQCCPTPKRDDLEERHLLDTEGQLDRQNNVSEDKSAGSETHIAVKNNVKNSDYENPALQELLTVRKEVDDDVLPFDNDGMDAALQIGKPVLQVAVEAHEAFDDDVPPKEYGEMDDALQMEKPAFQVPVEVHRAFDDDIPSSKYVEMDDALQMEKPAFQVSIEVHRAFVDVPPLENDKINLILPTEKLIGLNDDVDDDAWCSKTNKADDWPVSLPSHIVDGSVMELRAMQKDLDESSTITLNEQCERLSVQFEGYLKSSDEDCEISSEESFDFLKPVPCTHFETGSTLEGTITQDSLNTGIVSPKNKKGQVYIRPPIHGGRPITVAEIGQLDYEDYLHENRSVWKRFKNAVKQLKPKRPACLC